MILSEYHLNLILFIWAISEEFRGQLLVAKKHQVWSGWISPQRKEDMSFLLCGFTQNYTQSGRILTLLRDYNIMVYLPMLQVKVSNYICKQNCFTSSVHPCTME